MACVTCFIKKFVFMKVKIHSDTKINSDILFSDTELKYCRLA